MISLLHIFYRKVFKMKVDTYNNPIGNKIRKIREFRGISQKNLASILKIEEKKLEKIENGLIIPKTPLLKRIAKALRVDIRSLKEPDINDPIGVLYTLFDLEETCCLNIDIKEDKIYLYFEDGKSGQINGYLKKWRRTKACLNKRISEECYKDWKYNFPYFDFINNNPH